MWFNHFEARVICGGKLNGTRPTTSTDLMPPYPLTWTLAVVSYLLCAPSQTHSLLDQMWELQPVAAPASSANVSWSPLVPPSLSFSPNLRCKHVCNWSSLSIIWRKRVGFRAYLVPLSMVTSAYLAKHAGFSCRNWYETENILLPVCLLSLAFNDLSSFY